MKRTIFRLPVVLLLVDSLVIIFAWPTAFFLRAALPPAINPTIAWWQFCLFCLLLWPLWLLVLTAIGLYKRDVYQNRLLESGRLLLGSFLGVLLLIGLDFFTRQSLLPGRLVPLIGFLLTTFGLLAGRAAVSGLRSYLFKKGVIVKKVAVIGSSPSAINLIEVLLENPQRGSRLVAVAGGEDYLANRLRPGIKYYPDPRKIPWGRLKLESVIVDDRGLAPEVAQEVIKAALKNYVRLRLIPTASHLLYASVSLDIFNQTPVLTINQTALGGFGLVAKRLFDIFFGLGLLLLSAPLLLLAIILIKITAPREPIIFRHWRLSQFEKNIPVYKLRTMHQRYSQQSPAVGLAAIGRPDLAKKAKKGYKIKNDPRVTTIGRWLRRSSIDELPQLVNVVLGHISLVGPRAIPRSELTGYERYIPTLMSVKTGLTGLAQVSGRDNLSPREKIEINIYYIKHWSPWLDLMIILKTGLRVIARKDVNG